MMRTFSVKLLLYLVFAITSIHLGRPQKCFLSSLTRDMNVSDYRRHYAMVVGLDYNEPKLPLHKSTQNLFDNFNQCGKPAVDGSTAVMNGHDAPEKAWPWQALLISETPDNKTGVCGGSLISESWVLTAAHCLKEDNLVLFLGVTDISTLREDVSGNDSTVQMRRPEKIIAHKGYESHQVDDIALVKLDKAVIFDDYVQPVCLPKPGQTFDNGEDGNCYATGWGVSNMTHDDNLILQQAKVNVMPQSLCAFSFSLLGSQIDGRILCTDLNDDESGICYGDSGGPLACKIDGRFVLMGVTHAVATREDCAHIVFPPLDMRVTEYLDWIAVNIGENEQ